MSAQKYAVLAEYRYQGCQISLFRLPRTNNLNLRKFVLCFAYITRIFDQILKNLFLESTYNHKLFIQIVITIMRFVIIKWNMSRKEIFQKYWLV